jgi:hypothetical protein
MSDDGHLSPTDLNLKMDNHKKLEEDVMSRKNRVEMLTKYVMRQSTLHSHSF